MTGWKGVRRVGGCGEEGEEVKVKRRGAGGRWRGRVGVWE